MMHKRFVCPDCGRSVAISARKRHLEYWHQELLPGLGGFRPGAGRKVKRLFTSAGAKGVIALYYESIGQDKPDNLDPVLKQRILSNANIKDLAILAALETEVIL